VPKGQRRKDFGIQHPLKYTRTYSCGVSCVARVKSILPSLACFNINRLTTREAKPFDPNHAPVEGTSAGNHGELSLVFVGESGLYTSSLESGKSAITMSDQEGNRQTDSSELDSKVLKVDILRRATILPYQMKSRWISPKL